MTLAAPEPLRAPFPRFGGKRAVAVDVWAAFGNVPNYVEPFFGTGAVLLARPHMPHVETVNDADCYLANFWRSVQADAAAVARWADWPVNEADLHARHAWLTTRAEFRERMRTDPDYCDPKVAGWWVWGACAWIADGWCDGKKPSQKLPHLGDAGRGIHRPDDAVRVPDIMSRLARRLRMTRVACGDWTRVTGEAVTTHQGLTAAFLDPPYAEGTGNLYSEHDRTLSVDVRAWAITNGDNPKMRIALCGYDGEHVMPATWREHAWKARGGYGSQAAEGANENAKRERIWFSPHCLKPEPPKQGSLW